jgi:hypothetical protein
LRRGIFLVRGVLNSHRNLESHQVTLPSSSSQLLIRRASQSIATEERLQIASYLVMTTVAAPMPMDDSAI